MAEIIDVLQRLSSPPVQVLRTFQPTHTTVSYTVSTRPESNSIATRLRFSLNIALRILVGSTVVLLLWLKWCTGHARSLVIPAWALDPSHEEQLLHFVSTVQWRYTIPSAVILLYLALRRGYTEESLTVLRGLGLQTSTASSIYLRTPVNRFIPTTSIQDIFIHEAFKGFEVKFYLAVVVEGEEDVVVVFPRSLPPREILECVWRGSRKCLWEETGRHGHKSSRQESS